MARLTVFSSPDQALAARHSGWDLRVSGFSLTLYVAHRCSPRDIARAFDDKRLKVIHGPTTYDSKLRSGTALRYGAAIDVDRDYSLHLQTHTLRRERSLAQTPLWIVGSRVVVCAMPMRFQVPALRTRASRDLEFDPNFRLQQPLDISDLLRILTQTATPAFMDQAAISSAESLAGVGVVAEQSRAIENTLGLDIWSIAGTTGRSDDEVFNGPRDSANLSWPLTALLNYSSDHIANGFFDEISHEEVYAQLRHGHGFMHDHAVFINNSCCLEVTHFGDWTPQRSWDRLLQYGFDSSSLFLWSLAILRSETYRALSERFGSLILELTDQRGLATPSASELYEECLQSLRLLDSLQALHLALKEQRSQDLDEVYYVVFGDHVLEQAARSRLDAVRSLLLERADRVEDDRRQSGVARLTLAAALLAVAAIPGAVAQFDGWAENRQYVEMVIASVMMLAAVVLTLTVGPRAISSGGSASRRENR